MKKYTYSATERELNKAMKFNEQEFSFLKDDINATKDSLAHASKQTEQLIQQLGYAVDKGQKEIPATSSEVSILALADWDYLMKEAHASLPFEVELDELLDISEFTLALKDYQHLTNTFKSKTKLNKTDLSFLKVAIALQFLRLIFISDIGHRYVTSKKTDLSQLLYKVFKNSNDDGNPYRDQYDFLCFMRDFKTIESSLTTAQLINVMISSLHGYFYNEKVDGNRDLYEYRTKKIILYSNTIVTSSQLVTTLLTKNLKKLDVGGLVMTLNRLLFDHRFMLKIQEEFIQTPLNEGLKKELDALDEILSSYNFQNTKKSNLK